MKIQILLLLLSAHAGDTGAHIRFGPPTSSPKDSCQLYILSEFPSNLYKKSTGKCRKWERAAAADVERCTCQYCDSEFGAICGRGRCITQLSFVAWFVVSTGSSPNRGKSRNRWWNQVGLRYKEVLEIHGMIWQTSGLLTWDTWPNFAPEVVGNLAVDRDAFQKSFKHTPDIQKKLKQEHQFFSQFSLLFKVS